MHDYTLGLVVYIRLGFIKHYGIVAGVNERGEVIIISNSKKHGQITEETLESFSGGREVIVCNSMSNYQPEYLVNRARSQLGKGYGLFNGNCEHFVRWVHHQKPESPQLQFFVILATVTLLTTVLARR